MEFQDVLKRRRKELNLTLKDVAKRVGVTEATVQRWESGNIKSLRQGRISTLADVLETTPSKLMGWEEKSEASADLQKQELLTIFHDLDKKDQEKLISYARELKKEASKGMTTVKFAARDGTYKELQLTDEQLQELIKKAEALEDVPDNL